jgi:catecholate siderophore receptor
MPTHRTTAAQPTDRMSPCPSGEAKAVMHAPTIYLSGTASREPTARVLPLGAGLFLGSLLAGPIMAQAVGAPAATAVDTVTAQAGAEKAVVVEPVEVSSQRPRESYLTDKTRVGRVQVDPHLLPQAVTSVPGKLMEEQQVGSLREELRNVSGLTFNAAEGGAPATT